MKTNIDKTVFVMMSGGVDSSVAASVLQEQGYSVVGVFMKCWSIDALTSLGADKDLYGCFWEEDATDARQVAASIGIPFYVWDFQEEYKQRVVEYMLEEYKSGRTPNPDVMCNSTIKFGIFYEKAMQLGADFVATGHYVKRVEQDGVVQIHRGDDTNKDQSYFVWRVPYERITQALFPVGEFSTKAEVRTYAHEHDLITSNKPDSQGLCFIGTTPLRDLLLQTLGEKQGNIITHEGTILGQHPGAFLYTIGQRQKLGLSGGPWFVSEIRIDTNEVVVTHGNEEIPLLRSSLQANGINWLVPHNAIHQNGDCEAQIRYRQHPEKCTYTIEEDTIHVTFTSPVRAISRGQSIVLYSGSHMLGGATIL